MTLLTGFINTFTVMDFLIMIFFYFGEGIIMLYTSLALTGVKYNWTRLLLCAILYAIFVSLVRKLYIFFGIPFGTHSLILAIIFTLLIYAFFKTSLFNAIVGSIISFSLILAASPLALKAMEFFNIPVDKLSTSAATCVAIGYTEDIYLLLFAIFVTVTRLNINKIIKI